MGDVQSIPSIKGTRRSTVSRTKRLPLPKTPSKGANVTQYNGRWYRPCKSFTPAWPINQDRSCLRLFQHARYTSPDSSTQDDSPNSTTTLHQTDANPLSSLETTICRRYIPWEFPHHILRRPVSLSQTIPIPFSGHHGLPSRLSCRRETLQGQRAQGINQILQPTSQRQENRRKRLGVLSCFSVVITWTENLSSLAKAHQSRQRAIVALFDHVHVYPRQRPFAVFRDSSQADTSCRNLQHLDQMIRISRHSNASLQVHGFGANSVEAPADVHHCAGMQCKMLIAVATC